MYELHPDEVMRIKRALCEQPRDEKRESQGRCHLHGEWTEDVRTFTATVRDGGYARIMCLTVCAECEKKLSTCECCGAKKRPDRERCEACARAAMAARETAQYIGPMIAAGMLPVAAEVQSLREQVAEAQREQMAKIEAKFSETDKSLADLAGEEDISRDVQDGLWRAGVETLAEQMRDLIVCGLVGDLPEAERESARATVARCFNGRWGKAIVAGVSGGAMHLGALNNYGLPLLSPETSIRLSREFRILGIAAGSKEVIDRAATFLNGGLTAIGSTLSNLNKLSTKS